MPQYDVMLVNASCFGRRDNPVQVGSLVGPHTQVQSPCVAGSCHPGDFEDTRLEVGSPPAVDNPAQQRKSSQDAMPAA